MKSKLIGITHLEEDSVRPLTNGHDHDSRQDGEGLRQEVTVKFSANDVGKRSVDWQCDHKKVVYQKAPTRIADGDSCLRRQVAYVEPE